MSVDTVVEHFRGVHCRRCGKPVKVPALVAKKESASNQEQNENGTEYHLISRVFVLRCHACRKESIYSINQIEDVAFVPAAAREMAREATN